MKLVKAILFVLLALLVVYLAAAFIAWEINPRNWSELVRALVGVVVCLFLVLSQLFNMIISLRIKKAIKVIS